MNHPPYRSTIRLIENQPNEHVVTAGRWAASKGKMCAPKIIAVCPSKEDADDIAKHLNEHASLVMHKEAAELFEQFLATLNKGWLGKTTGDVGLLNDAYLKLTAAKAALASSNPQS